jgi:hypothetical protein
VRIWQQVEELTHSFPWKCKSSTSSNSHSFSGGKDLREGGVDWVVFGRQRSRVGPDFNEHKKYWPTKLRIQFTLLDRIKF